MPDEMKPAGGRVERAADLEECVPPEAWIAMRSAHLVLEASGTIEVIWIPSPIDPVWEVRDRHYTPYEVWSLFGWTYVSPAPVSTGNEQWPR